MKVRFLKFYTFTFEKPILLSYLVFDYSPKLGLNDLDLNIDDEYGYGK